MGELEVRALNKDEYSLWDHLVETSPYGTIFHKSSWMNIGREIFDRKLIIYGCFERGDLVGGCPLFIYKSSIFKMANSTFEMSPYGGIVLQVTSSSKVREREKQERDIIESLCNNFDKQRFSRVDIANSPNLVDIRPFIWNDWEYKLRYVYYFSLKDEIEKKVSKKVRNTVRKAINNAIKIKRSNDVDLFHDLFVMTYEKQDREPPVKKQFFEKIIALIESENIGEMWIAEASSGKVASAEIIIWDNKNAYRWAAASHTELKNTGATSLLLFEIFKDLKKREFKEINLMAANSPHLAKFISSFNPRLVSYYSVIKKSRFRKIVESIYHSLNRLKK